MTSVTQLHADITAWYSNRYQTCIKLHGLSNESLDRGFLVSEDDMQGLAQFENQFVADARKYLVQLDALTAKEDEKTQLAALRQQLEHIIQAQLVATLKAKQAQLLQSLETAKEDNSDDQSFADERSDSSWDDEYDDDDTDKKELSDSDEDPHDRAADSFDTTTQSPKLELDGEKLSEEYADQIHDGMKRYHRNQIIKKVFTGLFIAAAILAVPLVAAHVSLVAVGIIPVATTLLVATAIALPVVACLVLIAIATVLTINTVKQHRQEKKERQECDSNVSLKPVAPVAAKKTRQDKEPDLQHTQTSQRTRVCSTRQALAALGPMNVAGAESTKVPEPRVPATELTCSVSASTHGELRQRRSISMRQ